ncbi:MAG: NAD(P)/FAD-dependent oxidoreductase [Alphaproteobacteria bacterium]|uniref:NAD(P)/FAD-dependent oxidoreductase n=1 Tax=Candidatus Nitrobium versatile TaxID=2884831 RepID=A0A953M277_9BACT|nr:NAD(P)/FAD-dependent oxidoreductase [Candidatus Nitrobium versatile]
MREPISVIGAGPAGLTAAIVLARHGYRVRVYEKEPDVGHRLHGDFQGLENWSSEQDVVALLKDCGIETNFLCVPYSGGTVYAPALPPLQVQSSRPIFYLVQRGALRGTLDVGLKEQALSTGVEILFNNRPDRFSGHTIFATGPRGVHVLAVGITFLTAKENSAVALFDDHLAPKGYAYLLVHEGRGTLATVLFRDYAKGDECLERVTKFLEGIAGIDIRDPKRFCSFGNFFLSPTRKHHHVLYAGESAGFQDFLWGFGMRYAIRSGYLAAKSFIENTDYDALWKGELKQLLETALVNRYLFERIGHTGYRFLARKFARGNPCGFLRRQYGYSFAKQLLLPIARMRFKENIASPDLLHRNCLCEQCRGIGGDRVPVQGNRIKMPGQ